MASMPTEVLLLKIEGNTHIKNGKYLAAIDCYTAALNLTKSSPDHTATLLLNRCHALLQSQHFDSALADALSVITISTTHHPHLPPPEKALFRAARALYGLKRYTDSLTHLRTLLASYPQNSAAQHDLSRCQTRLREQTSGEYDFAAMLAEAEAKAPTPDMDRADFISSAIEVRECEIKSHGRGMFTTKEVEAGELLLCEKAFAVLFVDPVEAAARGEEEDEGDDDDDDDDEREQRIELDRRHALEMITAVKLERNPSLRRKFAELYPGPGWVDERDERMGEVVVDENAIPTRLAYNAFAFPTSTHTYHYAVSHPTSSTPPSPTPPTPDSNTTPNRGIFLTASFVNHSCHPHIRRSFIGDMILFRAHRTLPPHTELTIGYISGLEELPLRQRKLSAYGFECGCEVCVAEVGTGEGVMRERGRVVSEIKEIFDRGDVRDLRVYLALLDRLERTYGNPPSKEYRRAMISPLSNIITGCLQSGLEHEVITLTHRLLRALGFELEVKKSSYKILRWGFLIDEIVVAMVDLCDAYRVVEGGLVADAEREARLCYLIMCGEDVSWEKAYGPGGRREREREREGDDGGRFVERG